SDSHACRRLPERSATWPVAAAVRVDRQGLPVGMRQKLPDRLATAPVGKEFFESRIHPRRFAQRHLRRAARGASHHPTVAVAQRLLVQRRGSSGVANGRNETAMVFESTTIPLLQQVVAFT